ncbi:hypothetical protein BGZ63DRAFT_73400 [Mariannaea sp. PMI_226]|nr:hypothetical protein BGZ63DRAFT_73400 [Mariannaea sp. PMI_226]
MRCQNRPDDLSYLLSVLPATHKLEIPTNIRHSEFHGAGKDFSSRLNHGAIKPMVQTSNISTPISRPLNFLGLSWRNPPPPPPSDNTRLHILPTISPGPPIHILKMQQYVSDPSTPLLLSFNEGFFILIVLPAFHFLLSADKRFYDITHTSPRNRFSSGLVKGLGDVACGGHLLLLVCVVSLSDII